jgi:DNA repair protein RadC
MLGKQQDDLMKKKIGKKGSSNPEIQQWRHPGGKLRELGADSLTDAELLSILISTGIKGKSAEKIAEEILAKFGSFKGMANQPLKKFLGIKGIADVKIIRIAAAFEIARRIVNQVLREYEK